MHHVDSSTPIRQSALKAEKAAKIEIF